MFAKLYDTEVGQILAKIDTGEDGLPEVRIFFEPEGLGVCSLAITFNEDTEDGQWEKLDEVFEGLSEDTLVESVKSVLSEMITL